MIRKRIRRCGGMMLLAVVLPALLALTLAGPTAHARPSTQHGASAALTGNLAVRGNQLINTATNTAVQLRGVNRSGTEYACIQGWGIFDGPSDAASVAAIAGWHANGVRVLLNEDCWLGINGVPSQYGGANYRTAIYNYVHLLHQNGMYAEISMIWTAPGTTRATYQREMPDTDHTITAWKSIAAYFKNDHQVVFGVFGEPHNAGWTCWLNGGSTCGLGYSVAGMQSLVTAVRSTGATQPISVPGIDYANNLSQWLIYEPADSLHSLVAEFHQYGDNTCASSACWNSQELPVLNKVPLLTGELGESVNGTCSASFINTYMKWADSHHVSYQGWTWDTWGGCGVLITNYNGTPTAGFGQGFRTHLLSFGSGSQPGASLSPSSLAFGNQRVGTTSAAKRMTLKNTGNAVLTINSISLGGANAGDFARTTTCGASLAASASCTISVTFTPATVGSRSASLSVSDNASGSPQRAALAGTGV
ncbi:MAG: choice-of-anchor D domain-containing protein [Ktedonobacterales bacterium]